MFITLLKLFFFISVVRQDPETDGREAQGKNINYREARLIHEEIWYNCFWQGRQAYIFLWGGGTDGREAQGKNINYRVAALIHEEIWYTCSKQRRSSFYLCKVEIKSHVLK